MYGISSSGKTKKEKDIKVKFWRLSPAESSNIDRAEAARIQLSLPYLILFPSQEKFNLLLCASLSFFVETILYYNSSKLPGIIALTTTLCK